MKRTVCWVVGMCLTAYQMRSSAKCAKKKIIKETLEKIA